MPILITIDQDSRLTILTVIGEPHFEEVTTALKQFWEDQPTDRLLWDLRKASMAHLSSSELEQVAELVASHSGKFLGGRTAVVASRDLEYGLSRVLQTLGDIREISRQLMISRSIEDANLWLYEED